MSTFSMRSKFTSILLVSLNYDTVARSSGTVSDIGSIGIVTLTTGIGVRIGVGG